MPYRKLREDQLRQTIQELASQVEEIQIAPAQTVAPQIKVYAHIDINRDIVCNESLDAVPARICGKQQ